MNPRSCFSLVVPLALLSCTPLLAQHGVGGGHFSGGGISGHSVGHAAGHSLGRMFGHGSGRHDSRVGKVPGSSGDEPPLAGAAFIHGRVVQLPGPLGAMAPRPRASSSARFTFFTRMEPRAAFRPNRQFDSGFCGSFVFSWHNFLFPGDFDCFGGDPFLFNPFFSGGFIAGASSAPSAPLGSSPDPHAAGTTSVDDSLTSPPDGEFPPATQVTPEAPITLLQLQDGSMYGLTRYWVEGGSLHYVTNYGGENSVPLDRVDIAKTKLLNVRRGTPPVPPGHTQPQ